MSRMLQTCYNALNNNTKGSQTVNYWERYLYGLNYNHLLISVLLECSVCECKVCDTENANRPLGRWYVLTK